MTAPLPDYQEAIDAAISPAWARTPAIRVDLDDARNRILAEPLVADRDIPPFNRAAMDGYAIRHDDLSINEPIECGRFISAGTMSDTETPPGSCVRIATGAPVPPDLDTVIPHELSDRAEPVTFHTSVDRGNAIHGQGSDARIDDIICAAGTNLQSVELGLAAMIGRTSLLVHRPARIAIVTSGDEIVPVDHRPEIHQVRNSNLIMVADLLARMGGDVVSKQWVPDDEAVTMEAITRMMSIWSSRSEASVPENETRFVARSIRSPESLPSEEWPSNRVVQSGSQAHKWMPDGDRSSPCPAIPSPP